MSGLARPREWDVVVATSCPAAGERCVLVRLQGGRTVVEEGDAEDAAGCAVDALAGDVEPPYRAVAQRRSADTWAVGAVAIDVAELPADLHGDELVLTVTESGEPELLVDGSPSGTGIDALVRIAGRPGGSYVLQAARLEGTAWEIAVDPL